MPIKSLAAFSQLNLAALANPFSLLDTLSSLSDSRRFIPAASSLYWNGSASRAASPAISGIADVLEVITGTPQAMASRIGSPKLSRKEGYRNRLAPLYIRGIFSEHM